VRERHYVWQILNRGD